ncbi:MAG: hypothetical protein K2M91_16525 [Lachnospiraceae bacterium]|nr:hypothetical protein [Lachnospiraceae bacterium]
MKKMIHIILLFVISSLTCIGCGTEKESFISQSGRTEFDRHVPDKTFTLEDKVKQVSDAYTAIQNNYQQIQEMIEDPSADLKHKQAALNFEDTYSDRIEELGEMNFSNLSEEEIDTLMSELREMVTAAREVNNALSTE